MKQPIPFLTTNADGKWTVNEGAVSILQQIKQPVAVITIIGKKDVFVSNKHLGMLAFQKDI